MKKLFYFLLVLGVITSCKNDETIVNEKLPEDFQEKQEFVHRTNAQGGTDYVLYIDNA